MRRVLLFGVAAFLCLVLLVVALPKTMVYYRSPSVSATIVDAVTGKPIEGVEVEVRWDAMRRTENEHNLDSTSFHVVKALTDKNGAFAIPAWGPTGLTRNWHYYDFTPTVTYSKDGYEKLGWKDNHNDQSSVTSSALPYGTVTLDRPSWDGENLPLTASPRKRAERGADGNVPIRFYGKVIDQEGDPVPDAKVQLELVFSIDGGRESDSAQKTLLTDQNGNFVLTNARAYGIARLIARKAGYEFSWGSRHNYRFGLKPNYTTDPAKPEVIKMWKKHSNEKLIESSWHGHLPGDGATNRFGLLDGVQSPEGELELILSSTLRKGIWQGHSDFSHKCEISLLSGGIQRATNDFPYLAPESGYEPLITIEQKAGAPNWKPALSQIFYIKTAEGRYGSLDVRWTAWQTPAGLCEWECYVNPSGKRDLER